MNSQVKFEPLIAEIDVSPVPTAKRKGLSKKAAEDLYKAPHSFVDFLPWVEYLADEGLFLLEDNNSVGAVFEIKAKGTEGRTEEFLVDVRNMIEEAMQDSFEEHDVSPWVLQTYTFDVLDIDHVVDEMRDYAKPEARNSQYTEEYLRIMAKHYVGITKEGGLFTDEDVSKTTWGGCLRKNYVVIYRRLGTSFKASEYDVVLTPIESIQETCEKFFNALKPIGLEPTRKTGGEFHNWMQGWFNPSTDLFDGDIKKFLNTVKHDEDSLPFGNEFAETLLFDFPRSDHENKCWWFGDTAMRCISVDGIRRRPQIGHTTGEIKRGDSTNAMMDLLPKGTIMVQTVVIVPQDTVESHIEAIDKSAIGESAGASRTKSDCNEAKKILGERHKFYRVKYAFYLKSESVDSLNRMTNAARAVLLGYNFRAIAVKDDIKALDNFIINLPMNYDPDSDRREGWRQAQLAVVQHIANLSCFFGRSTGTGNPGITAFNRGGEPLTFDPLNPDDRRKNGHMLLLGPTGAGKSATLGSMIANVMAVHRPRKFIIEAGNSFGLLGDWFETQGLSVNQVSLKPGNGVTLSPFAEAYKALSQDLKIDDDDLDKETAEIDLSGGGDDDGEEQRDILGEMEIIAQLMITGGEPSEVALLRRSDKRLIRDAILLGAKNATDDGRPTLTEDVRKGFYQIAQGDALDISTSKRLREMGDSIGLFCDGFGGEVFNSKGTQWPEVDVTIIDLGMFAREGYEAHLAIAVISSLNMINNIAERDQHSDREIVVSIDEAHIVTTNVLLAPFLVKIVKMWRKLGAWLWLATQNLEDFPDASKKMLNMIEWWICLVMPKEEVEEIARFRTVNDAQRQLLLSATKSPRKYTEGVALAENIEALFRNVPPSLMLSLAMTEKHEKAARRKLMLEHGIKEVDAAIMIADEIDHARGIR